MALAFPGTEEHPHFDRAAFRITGKRTFATLHEGSATANLKLSAEEQSAFCAYDKAVYPVPNKWGQQGWTTVELGAISEDIVKAALESAYKEALTPGKKR